MMKQPNNEEKTLAARSLEIQNTITQVILSRKETPFRGRGLDDRTIEALINSNIDAPERLLFMTKSDLRKIPGLGKEAFAQIAAYRAEFMRPYSMS